MMTTVWTDLSGTISARHPYRNRAPEDDSENREARILELITMLLTAQMEDQRGNLAAATLFGTAGRHALALADQTARTADVEQMRRLAAEIEANHQSQLETQGAIE